MLEDLVIDTNVLMHANNSKEERQEDTIKFLKKLLASDTFICVDEGFDPDEAKNKSKIIGEYYQYLAVGSFGHVKVAFNSKDKMFVSHDVAHFSPEVKKELHKKLDVKVTEAKQAAGLL